MSDQLPDEPKTPESRFYVSVVDGQKFGLLVGPFMKHASALALVDRARAVACKLNEWAHFYGFGTVQMKDGKTAGILNDYFTEELSAEASLSSATP